MINKIICKILGHKKPLNVKWSGIYGSSHSNRHGECPRCKKKLIIHSGILGLAGWVEEN